MKIVTSSEFRSDIFQIFNYIAKDSSRYANETISKIYFKISYLEYFPYIGRYIP